MDTSTIRIAIRTLPDHFDRSRIPAVLQELQSALLEEAGIHARAHADDITEADALRALQQLDPLWDELFPAGQARIVALLVERVDIATDGLYIRLRVDGLSGLTREMLAGDIGEAA